MEGEDRLSSLPDDILIGILSRLPLELAILSGSLSRRWRHLWKNITSIHISTQKFNSKAKFVTTIDAIMGQITSPVIHTFTYIDQKRDCCLNTQSSLNSWLRKICDKNVRELKVAKLSIYCNCVGECRNIVISAPKLEYLEIRYFRCVIVSFVEEPILLREIKSDASYNHHYDLSQNKNKLMSKLTSVTRLTFNMSSFSKIKNVSSLVRLCPALEVLIIQFHIYRSQHFKFAEPACESVLQRVKKIEIETYYYVYLVFKINIWELVESLLSNLMGLEEFQFQINNGDYGRINVQHEQEELTLCKSLYSRPTVMKSCEVRFVGEIIEMSRKAGPFANKANGEVITFIGRSSMN